MTIAPLVGPSWVQIDLDTAPPVVLLDAPSRIEPPDHWVVLVKANEDLGPVAAVFTDAFGTEARLGVERISARLLSVTMPTVGIATGPGELRVLVRDRACNAVEAVATVVVDRPRAFDTTLTFSRGLEAEVTVDHGFEVEMRTGHSLEAVASIDHAHEVEIKPEPSLNATLEITRGPAE